MPVGGLLCIAIIVEKERKKRKRKSWGGGGGNEGFPLPCIYFYGDLYGKKKKKERKKNVSFHDLLI